MTLQEQWQIKFNTTPPLSEATLRLVLNWYNQDNLRINRVLTRLEELSNVVSPNKSSLSIGTKLVRRWRGKNYEVDVLSEGFLYQGQTYKSLTAIATKISGVHQSGNAFFKQTKARGKS